VAQEGIHSLNTSRYRGDILKIGISKAFDWVNWSYLRLLLTHLEFEDPFIKWVMVCITLVSFIVHINGVTSPFFQSERGLGQGFPLFSLLFLLVEEGLSRALTQATKSRDFQGILVEPGLRITHLLFVDNVLIFCSGRPRDAEKLLEIINLFWATNRIIINIQKSTINFVGLEMGEVDHFLSLFPFQTFDLSEGIKYLGFQLKPNDYKKIN
jgi:hypothetical protein